MTDYAHTREEPLVHIMVEADHLAEQGYPTGEIVAALLSCALVRMVEEGLTQQKALELFRRSAHFAYNEGETTHDPH